MPRVVTADYTPVPSDLPMTEGHTDVDEALRVIFQQLKHLRAMENSGGVSLEDIEQQIAKAQKWGGFFYGILSVIGVVFVAGISFAVFRQEIATDDDVDTALHDAEIEHNGVDPDQRDAKGTKLGSHPDIYQRLTEHGQALERIDTAIESIETTQRKVDRRTEYQFEFSRWQADVTVAERQRKKPPAKPARLDELERELLFGH